MSDSKENLMANAQPVAAAGLLDRRHFLRKSSALAAVGATALGTTAHAATIGDAAPPWMKTPGFGLREYGSPSPFEAEVKRAVLKPYGDMAPGTGVSLTPLQHLNGTLTPNGLHFERSHNGVPEIDPSKHEVVIHGMVRQALKFSIESLLRYPMVSRTCFIECAGNSFFTSNAFAEPMQVPVGHIHGLVSSAEWTGVLLSTLLEDAGVDPAATWLLAEGADAAGMSRSIPLAKAQDDVIVALFQNGERIRPEQGYPVRLVVPGFEGNMNVKWLRRIKVTDQPTHTKDETSKYTELRPDGKADQFTYTMGVKSTITKPATGLSMSGPGLYAVTGLAWSGHGSITRVEVSADGGQSWADAALDETVLSQNLTRFQVPWRWDGSPLVLQSRAHDANGNVQPTRAQWSAGFAAGQLYHNNAIQSWKVNTDGSIANVYA
ncbi:MAG: sulfite dehydrogenase [Gammaproteobacteria bacterium]|nr:sulfite dehydrogenase [Gammaproteobacteria bacterium]